MALCGVPNGSPLVNLQMENDWLSVDKHGLRLRQHNPVWTSNINNLDKNSFCSPGLYTELWRRWTLTSQCQPVLCKAWIGVGNITRTCSNFIFLRHWFNKNLIKLKHFMNAAWMWEDLHKRAAGSASKQQTEEQPTQRACDITFYSSGHHPTSSVHNKMCFSWNPISFFLYICPLIQIE